MILSNINMTVLAVLRATWGRVLTGCSRRPQCVLLYFWPLLMMVMVMMVLMLLSQMMMRAYSSTHHEPELCICARHIGIDLSTFLGSNLREFYFVSLLCFENRFLIQALENFEFESGCQQSF